MRIILTILCTIGFFIIVHAQQNLEINRLLQVLATTKNDNVKAATLNQLGFMGKDYGFDAKKFAREGLLLSTKIGNRAEQAIAHLNLSQIFNEAGKYDSALLAIEQAQELFPEKDSVNHASFYAKYYFSLGMLSLPGGNDKDGTLQNLLNAFRFARMSKDHYLISVCYGAVSKAYNLLRQFDKSIENSSEYLDFALAQKDTLIIAKGYQVLSASYFNAGNMEKHGVYFKEYEKLLPKLANPYYNWLYADNRAMLFAEKGLFAEAIAEAEKAIRVAQNNKLSSEKILSSYYLAGYCYYLAKQYRQSNDYMMKVAALADSINSPEYKMYAASGLSENYYFLNDFKKAYEYLSKQLSWSDSISSEKIKVNSNYLHIKNKIEQKDNLLKQQEQSIHQNRLINYILIGGLLSLLTIGLLVYRNYHNRKKMQQQRIAELETEKQLLATQSLLKGQEEERSRIAKDLHDGLGGLLSGVKLQLGAMKGNLILTEENGNAFSRALDKLDESIAEMRRVAHNMMPETLLKFGLQQAIVDYSSSLSHQQRFVIDCEFRGLENRLDQTTEVVVYRIVQELINNAVKHSEATNILVQLIRHDENQLNITVEDNGKGLSPADKEKITAGLRNVRSRVEYLNGKMDIQSGRGKGVSVYIECEVKPNE